MLPKCDTISYSTQAMARQNKAKQINPIIRFMFSLSVYASNVYQTNMV